MTALSDHKDALEAVKAEVARARESGQRLAPVGGNTKAWYGGAVDARPLSTAAYSGIVDYAPAELVITARAGTPLEQVEAILTANKQCLPFEPPRFGRGATLGGCVASGLTGPRRPFVGLLRDFTLGVRVLTSSGDEFRFGGTVMKNVAGFDLSRLLAGSWGTLGVLLEVSLKVLPAPDEATFCVPAEDPQVALNLMQRVRATSRGLSALAWYRGMVYARCREVISSVGFEPAEQTGAVTGFDWSALRDLTLAGFDGAEPLWRVVVAANTIHLPASDSLVAMDWCGGLRWYTGDTPPAIPDGSGFAERFWGPSKAYALHPAMPTSVQSLQQRVKRVLDPEDLFDGSRLMPEERR